MTTTRADRRKGVLLMIGAALCWSTGGILVRNADLPDAWEIVLWRSIFMVLFVGATLFVWHRGDALRRIAAVGAPGILAGITLAATFFFFILSITRTTVANTLVLMSTGPFFVALAARLFLGEPVARRTWLAIAVALAGIVFMFAGDLGAGRIAGNMLALGVPLAFAANIVVLRRYRAEVDMVPAVLLAGIFSIVLALPFAWPLTPTARDLVVLALMGCVQLGAGCVMMTMASRYLSASEIGLIALLETTLGPIWVWIGLGERPTALALAGGMVVIGAIIGNGVVSLRRAAVPVQQT